MNRKQQIMVLYVGEPRPCWHLEYCPSVVSVLLDELFLEDFRKDIERRKICYMRDLKTWRINRIGQLRKLISLFKERK